MINMKIQGATHKANRATNQGFTLLELVVATCIAVILILTFLGRVLFYQEQVEKAAMIGVVNSVQSSLNIQQLGLLLKNKDAEITQLAAENPLNWLEDKPHNYAGEFFDPASDSIAPGNWAFDLKSRELIYAPDSARHITISSNEQKWIRFHVKLMQSAAKDSSGKSNLVSATFEPVYPYRWQN